MLNDHNPSTFDEPSKPMAGGRVVVIQPDGSKTNVEVGESATLQRMYHVIGCSLVELIELPSHRGRRVQMIVDEEGCLTGLPLNPIASAFADRPIVGIAVILIGLACWD